MATLINLLPDLRQEKARNNQRRRIAKLSAIGITGASLAVVLILFLITLGQKIRISQLSSDIKKNQAQIDGINDLGQILTVQAHLNSLADLYKQRVLLTKLYGILGSVQPREVALQSLSIDEQNVFVLTGQARNFGAVTRFVKALEASNVTIGVNASTNNQPYFSNVKLATVTADSVNIVSFSLTSNVSPEVTHASK